MSESEAAAVWVDIEELVPWGENPRVNDPAVSDVAASISRFGFAAPIVARRDNHQLIAGHTRLKAAIQLGMRRVPVRFMDLDDRQAKLLALADNRLNEKAHWSMPDLQELLSSFSLEDVALAGWSGDDLEKMAKDLLPEAPVEFTEFDESIKTNCQCPKCGYEWSDGK